MDKNLAKLPCYTTEKLCDVMVNKATFQEYCRRAFACVFGVSLAMVTPSATTTIMMVQVAGYRFKDYFRFGGLVGVIGLVITWIALVLFYGLL